MEDLRAWPLIVKGHQRRIFLDNGPLPSERVLEFKFQSYPGPLVPWGDGDGGTSVLGTAGGLSSLLCACFCYMATVLLSLKINSVSP